MYVYLRNCIKRKKKIHFSVCLIGFSEYIFDEKSSETERGGGVF